MGRDIRKRTFLLRGQKSLQRNALHSRLLTTHSLYDWRDVDSIRLIHRHLFTKAFPYRVILDQERLPERRPMLSTENPLPIVMPKFKEPKYHTFITLENSPSHTLLFLLRK